LGGHGGPPSIHPLGLPWVSDSGSLTIKMKALSTVIAVSTLVAILSPGTADAQIVVPGTPKKFETRGTGGLGTGSSVGVTAKDPQPKETVTVYFTTVSKSREWTNTEGKNMTAKLVAFVAPKRGEQGPVVVINEGKVRFLMSNAKKPIDYPLEKLSQPDQIFVKAIAQAASKGAPNPGVTKNEGAESGGKE